MSTASLSVPSDVRTAVRQLLRIALPLVAHGVVTVVATMNDTVLLGRSGAAALGSAAAAGSVLMVGVLLLTGLVGTPTQILVARALGAGDEPGAARAAERSMPMVVACAAVMIGGLLVAAPPLVRAIGGSAIDPELAGLMLRVAILGLPFTGLSVVARSYATGRGATTVVVRSSLVAVAVDILVSIALLPLLGPIGVTVGTAVSPLAGAAVFLAWIAKQRSQGVAMPRLLAAAMKLPGRTQREPFRLGWSEGLLGATSAGAGVVVTVLLSTNPPEVLAASRALEALTVVCWPVLMGFSSAGLTLLSHARGAGSHDGYRYSLSALLRTSGAVGAALALTLPLVTVPVLKLSVGAEIAAVAKPVTWLAGLQALWIVATTLSLSICRSFRDTRTPLWSSLLGEYAVFLPVGWVLCRMLDGGIVGLYITHHIYYLAFALIATTSAVRHLLRPWQERSRYEVERGVHSDVGADG